MTKSNSPLQRRNPPIKSKTDTSSIDIDTESVSKSFISQFWYPKINIRDTHKISKVAKNSWIPFPRMQINQENVRPSRVHLIQSVNNLS